MALTFTFTLVAASLPAAAAGEVDFSVFEAHDETSEITIDYDAWSLFLRPVVQDVGLSNRYKLRLHERSTGTHLKMANTQRSWLEGNRFRYHLLKDKHIDAISDYRRELEGLPETFGGIERLNRREQLAYWLNLYNVTVLEQVASRYPVVRLKRIHAGSKKRTGVWDQKLLQVMGVRLSLNDIRDRILIPVFKDPVVIYGLHQGVIGGPNIRATAFTGQNVRNALRLNAIEFVNSIRGVHRKGKVARASEFYGWSIAAFPGGEAQLRAHLYGFADEKTRAILDKTETLETSYFDWHIADIYNGRPNHLSTYPVNSVTARGFVSTAALEPEHVQRYRAGLLLKFREFGFPRTRVDIIEVPRNEDADGSATDGAGPGGSGEDDNEDDRSLMWLLAY